MVKMASRIAVIMKMRTRKRATVVLRRLGKEMKISKRMRITMMMETLD